MSEIMENGFQGKSASGVYVSNELLEYLEDTFDSQGGSSSLAGDGLASCVLGFDHYDQERSRMILLATDNEILGDQIYTLKDAIDFAKRQNVVVTALYPSDGSTFLSSEGRELERLVKETGGEFYDASNPASVQGVIAAIEEQQKVDLEGSGEMLETDKPASALAWTVLGMFALFGMIALGRV